jgi:hypothetical protein
MIPLATSESQISEIRQQDSRLGMNAREAFFFMPTATPDFQLRTFGF